MTEQELNRACEIVRDLANEHFGDWEQSCKFEDNFHKAMEAVIKDSLNPEYDAEYLQSKIDAFSEARKKDGKTADEMLDECRGGALELTWQDMAKIADIIGHTSRLTRDGITRSPEEFYKEVLSKFKEL